MPDQNNENSWVEPTGSSGSQSGNAGREPWSSQQGGQTGQEPWSSRQGSMQNPANVQPGQGGIAGGITSTVRQDIEGQINGLIDHYANQVPGGTRFAPEAKQAMSGVLDGLQRQLENHAQSSLGGLGGGLFGGNEGGQSSGGGYNAGQQREVYGGGNPGSGESEL